jgi:uncharacterized protein (TIGR02118 family)
VLSALNAEEPSRFRLSAQPFFYRLTFPVFRPYIGGTKGDKQEEFFVVKLVGCLRRKPGMSTAEFHCYWKDVHGPLVQSVTEFSRYVRKYGQGHSVADRVPGFPPPAFTPFDGVAELWFDSVADIGKAFAEPRYLEIIRPDELKFLDLPNCSIFVVEEVSMNG